MGTLGTMKKYDVTLPNGFIVRDVPESATKDQIMQRAIDEGWATANVFGVEEPDLDVLELGGEMGKGFARGFGGGLLSAGAGLAELADVATDTIGLENLIDSGDENEIIRLANEGKENLNEAFGVGNQYKDNYLVKLSEGLGSIGSFFVPGGVAGLAGKAASGARAAKIAATTATTTAGIGFGASEQADRVAAARERGETVSEGQEDIAIALGGLVGWTEAFTPLAILKKIKRFKDPVKNQQAFNAVTSAIKTGLGEGLQEVLASVLQDAIEDGLYSDEVTYTDTLWDDFTVGAGAGAILDAVTTGVFNRRSKAVRDAEIEREQQFREEEEAQAEALYDLAEYEKGRGLETEETEFDPTQPYQGSQVNLKDRGAEYASQIARNAIQRTGVFPDSGSFEVVEERLPEGSSFKVIHSQTGQQYGEASPYMESSIHLMANLNQEIVNRNVNNSVIDSLDLSPESYTPEQAESLYVIGQKLNRPKRFTVTSAVLNEAAGTTQSPKSPYRESQTIDQLYVSQYGVPPYTDRGEKLYQDLSDLTAAQQINFERRKKGLREIDEFTLQEAKQVLGDKYPKVFDVLLGVKSPDITEIREDFGSVGARLARSRQEYQDQRQTLEEIGTVLQEKNITSSVDSPEVKYVFEKIVNESDVSKMTPSQRMFLAQEIRKLPVVPEPASLPDFRPKPYTKEQYNNAIDYVAQTGDGTVENIERNLGDIGSVNRVKTVASALHRDLKKAGLIGKSDEVSVRSALPSPEALVSEPIPTMQVSEEAKQLEKALSEDLQGIGLDDIRLRVLDELKVGRVTREGELVPEGKATEDTEAYFKPMSKTVFLALDKVTDTARDQTPEARRAALTDLLNHEVVHGVRALDLWTGKEWSLLENLARKKTVPGRKGNITFYRDAQEAYRDLDAVGRMEEAVAELIRYGQRDKRLITGKPKSLVERMYSFFEKTGNALRGTGFQSFEDVINRLETGEIGARERGEIRTLRATEKRMGAVPERGIGRERDVRIAQPKVIAPQTEEDEVQAAKIKSIAKQQGFDTDNVYYHATASYRPIKKFRSDLRGTEALGDVIAGHFTLDHRFANRFVPAYGGATYYGAEVFSPAIYPVYLRAKNPFDAGKIWREKDAGYELQLLVDQIEDLDHPYYKKWAFAGERTAEDVENKRDDLLSKVDAIGDNFSDISFEELEALSPFIRSAGWDSYIDYEDSISEESTGIAIFDPSNIKGVFAKYDPSGVPEGYKYEDDIMFARQRPPDDQRLNYLTQRLAYLKGSLEQDTDMYPATRRKLVREARQISDELRENFGGEDIVYARKKAPEGIANTELLPTAAELAQMRDGTYKPEKKRSLVEAAQFLQERWEAATGRTEPFEYTPENIGIISDILATEALVALESDSNAIGWYDRKIKAAKDVMRLVEPAIMSSPESEAAFDFGLAVTSNGQAVIDNFAMATEVFRFYERKGRFPETIKEFGKGGERNEAMLQAFKFHNAYNRSGQNQPIREFFDENFTVRELNQFAAEFNARVGFEAMKVPSAEGADVSVKGSYVLGPKIGQGFYQNIRGNYNPLTTDIWWMRMWNRIVGRPFEAVLSDEKRNERRKELKTLIRKTGGLPRKLVNDVLKGNDQTRTEIYQDPDLFDSFIVDLERRYQKFYKEYKKEKGVNHVKPLIFKKTNTYVGNMKPQLQAQPKDVPERAYMRQVVEEVRKRLAESGYNITTADFQALMWYPEKQLFRALGVQPARGSDNDYLDAAEALAEKEGIARGKVEKALRDADRERTDDGQPSPRRGDGLVRGDAGRIDGEEKRAAFNPRPRGLTDEALEARKRTAEDSAAEFAERNPPDTILGAVDRSPQVQKDLIDQEISGEPFSFQTKGYRFGKKFVYWAADKYVGLKDAEREINDYRKSLGLNPLKATESPYTGEESIAGILGDKMREFENNRKKPLADKIADSGLSLDEIDEFLIMRHAIERNEMIAARDESRDVEEEPGSGKLKGEDGEKLSNSFVKRTMKERYDMDWDSATDTWSKGNARADKLNDIAKDLDLIINETLDTTIEGGLLDRETGENIRGLYNYYSPMRGQDIEDDYAEMVVIGSSLSSKGKEYFRSMGRRTAAQSPLGHILLNAERAMSRATKNKQFGHRLVNVVRAYPDENFWRVISPEDPRYTRVFEKNFTYVGPDKDLQGQTFTEIPKGAKKRDYVQKIVPRRDALGLILDNDLIGVKINGQQVYVEIADKRLRNAIASMDGGTADNLIQKFGVVNRWLSMMNTSLNPEFVIGNFSRDIQTAIMNILGEQDMSNGKAKDQNLVAKVLKDTIPSMGVFYKAIRRWNPKDGTFIGNIAGIDPRDLADAREYLESGAKADWFHSRPPDQQVETIQSMVNMSNGTFTGSVNKRFQQVMRFVEDTNSAVENAVRFATFKESRDQMLDAGVPRNEAVAQAATLAKNLTINFNRKGMAGDLINAMYLFFNASIQGTANFARGLFGPTGNPFSKEASRVKQGMVGGLIAFGALSALRAEEESEENPDTGRSFYSEIPAFVKERNIVIMADPTEPLEEGAKNTYIGKDGKEYAGSQYYYTIPLPYGYNVFHVLGQNLFEMQNDHISPLQATSNITSAFLGSFSPIGFSSPFPTIVQPFWEIAQNENFWGGPIFRGNFPTGTQLPASQLAMSGTRTPFKWMANTLNSLTGGNEQEPGSIDISPDVLEHLAEFTFGGAGAFGMRNLNAIEKWQKDEELKVREIPFLRRVKGEADERVSVADFYDRKIKIEQKESRLDALRGQERIKYRRENADYIRTFGDLKRAEKRLRVLRNRRNILKEKATRSPENANLYAKAEQEIYEQMNSVYNKFNKAYDIKVGRTK